MPAAAIPEFWLTALRNHIGLADLITDRDEAALKHLADIRIAYLTEGKPGFKLQFYFTPNEFFENELLEKTYLYLEEVGYSGDFLYDRAIGTEIKWKEDKDLTKEIEIKKQRNKSTCCRFPVPWRLVHCFRTVRHEPDAAHPQVAPRGILLQLLLPANPSRRR